MSNTIFIVVYQYSHTRRMQSHTHTHSPHTDTQDLLVFESLVFRLHVFCNCLSRQRVCTPYVYCRCSWSSFVLLFFSSVVCNCKTESSLLLQKVHSQGIQEWSSIIICVQQSPLHYSTSDALITQMRMATILNETRVSWFLSINRSVIVAYVWETEVFIVQCCCTSALIPKKS